ncbi:MAG: branched-chain amino acid ABC transporter permease [Spirochaetes bacterium]|nr:branched-chain amino acid ABC transporter permease [Spirochaetota bacterium]
MATTFPLKSTLILFVSGVAGVFLPVALLRLGVIDAFSARVLTMGGVNALLAMSVNMIVGITGQLSLGQAGFLAIGAFSCIFFHADMGLSLPLSAFLAMLVTAFAGFLIGFPVMKLSGDYLAVVTLGFGEIIRIVFINLRDLTGGPNGRQFITPMILNIEMSMIVVFSVLVVTLAITQNLVRSTYGRAIMACRDDEIAANACGINIFRYKMAGFVVAAAIAGAGGALFAMVVGLVQPNVAQFIRSVDFLIFVVLGGMGSFTGSIMAAFVLTYLQEFLRFLQDFRFLVYPLILIFIMIFRPQGLLGVKEFSFVKTWDSLAARLTRKGKAAGGQP